jgi:[protein-PII] uridylyltransferase
VTIKSQRAALVARSDLAGLDLGRALAAQADAWFASLAATLPSGWALAATGGYALGSLCPGSDLDVMLLHGQRASDREVGAVAESIWYPIWDAGLKLSPATHSQKSALALARDDLVTATTLLGIRTLAGDGALVAEIRAKAVANWQKKPERWAARLRSANGQRWAQSGEVSSWLEPNLKDGRGGLRDLDVLRWAVALGEDYARALESPLGDLDAPAAHLLAARCELHRLTGRSSDVLLLQEQDALAAALGDRDADVLMRRLSSAARTIDWASDRLWRRVDRIIDPPRWPGHRTHTLVQPTAGLAVYGDELHLTAAADLDDPATVFEVAATAARSDVPLSREALATLTDDTPAEPPAPWSDRTRRAFISLLGAGDAMVPTVESLERSGLFSRYLPEWEHVRSLPQRNAFHTYNVDRHLLRTVANAAELVRTVSRPDLLLVAALLHDIGKGYPRDHTEVGVELVQSIMPRWGFSPDDTATVTSLVRHHLLLSEVATRRDLSDPRTAANVASAVETVERLELLRALTEADSLATGPSAWSNWKRSLIDRLTRSVAALLHGTAPAPVDDVEERFGGLLRLVRDGEPLAVDHDEPGDFVRLRLATRDRRGLFADVAGTLSLHRVDIIAADAWSTHDGIAIEQFHVLPRAGDPVPVGRIGGDLAEVVAGRLDVHRRLEERLGGGRSAYRKAVAAAPPRTEVHVSNDASDTTTMVDVRVPDGPAVLYHLSAALSECGVDIRSAKVATLGHEVVDVFYVLRGGDTPSQIPASEHDTLRAAVLAAVGG